MYLVDYSNNEITQWKTTTMKETVQLLVKTVALQEAYMLDDTQQRMTEFLTQLNYNSIDDDI